MELVMTATAGEYGPAAPPAGCGAVVPVIGFGTFLSAALRGDPGTGVPPWERLFAGPGSAAEYGVRDSGPADRNPVSGGDSRIATAGAEVDSAFFPDAGGAASSSPAPTLPAAGAAWPADGVAQAEGPAGAARAKAWVPGATAAAGTPGLVTEPAARHSRSADAPAPVSGERLLPGNAAAPGQTAAAGKAAPVSDGAVPAAPLGSREWGTVSSEVQPPRLDAPPGGAGEAPAPGMERSAPGAAVPNHRESQGSVQSFGARAETVPTGAAPVRILPGAADDGLRLPPAALRAEAVSDRSGPEAGSQAVETRTSDGRTVPPNADRQFSSQPQPPWPAADAPTPASRAPASTTIVPEPAGARAAVDRPIPVPNAGQSTAEFFPPGIRPPAAADPSPVTRQLAEAVVHHVRQIQVKAGEAVRVSISLDPPELGRVTLKLTFGRLGLEAVFYTPDRSVKAVIEQALPQLREALARQEINVGHTGVFLGEEKTQEGPRFFRGSRPGPGVPGEPDHEPPESGRQAEPRAGGLNYLV